MASTSDLTPLQVRHAVSVLTALPLRRPEGKTLSHRNLEFAERLLRNYLNSPNTKSPPSKEVLFAAVKSLLDPDCPPLAVKWNKDQLAQVLVEWITTVLGMEVDAQKDFFVRVHSKKGNAKDMEHETIFLKGTLDDGSPAGFSIYSPSMPQKSKKHKKQASRTCLDPPETPASASSSASIDSQFLREIEDLGVSEVASDGFATPRVSLKPAKANGDNGAK